MRNTQHGGIISRLMALLVIIVFFGALYVVRRPLLRMAGSYWVDEDEQSAAHADAIIVLGDDNFAGDRATRASELFRAGRAPQIVASGRMIRPYLSVAELIERDLISRGVPASAIVRFPHMATDTREEAQALRRLAADHHWRRVLLVTSNYHTRRAGYIFRKVFPGSTEVVTVAARDPDFDPNTWWENRSGRKLFFLEAVSYGTAWWELRQDGRR